MSSRRMVFAAAALASVTAVATAVAQPQAGPPPFDQPPSFEAFADGGGLGPGGRPGGPRGRHGLDPRRMADYLQLTEEQRTTARQLFESHREKVRPLMEARRALRDQLETALEDAGATEAALGQIVKQLHANRQAVETARAEAKASFAAILDATQKEKLEQLESVIEGLGPGRRHGRGRRG